MAMAGAEMRQLTLMKKGQYFLFRYQSGEESTVIRTLMEKADDPACPLDWFDAAVLSHQMGHRMAAEIQSLMKTKTGVKAS